MKRSQTNLNAQSRRVNRHRRGRVTGNALNALNRLSAQIAPRYEFSPVGAGGKKNIFSGQEPKINMRAWQIVCLKI